MLFPVNLGIHRLVVVPSWADSNVVPYWADYTLSRSMAVLRYCPQSAGPRCYSWARWPEQCCPHVGGLLVKTWARRPQQCSALSTPHQGVELRHIPEGKNFYSAWWYIQSLRHVLILFCTQYHSTVVLCRVVGLRFKCNLGTSSGCRQL